MATICGILCSTKAFPVFLSPVTTFNTPGGSIPASVIISAMRAVVTGVVSLGFKTVVFPAAIAGAYFHTAIIIG